MEQIVLGIKCEVSRETFPDGKHDVYSFTVPGWEPCSVTGLRAAKRVIRGRLDAAVRNTLELDVEEREVVDHGQPHPNK